MFITIVYYSPFFRHKLCVGVKEILIIFFEVNKVMTYFGYENNRNYPSKV